MQSCTKKKYGGKYFLYRFESSLEGDAGMNGGKETERELITKIK